MFLLTGTLKVYMTPSDLIEHLFRFETGDENRHADLRSETRTKTVKLTE